VQARLSAPGAIVFGLMLIGMSIVSVHGGVGFLPVPTAIPPLGGAPLHVNSILAASMLPSRGTSTHSSAPPRGAVAYTIDAFNETVLRATYIPDHGGFAITSEILIPSLHKLYMGAEGGDVWVVNTTSMVGDSKLFTPQGVSSMALDPKSGELWTAGSPWTISVLNLTDGGGVRAEINVSNGPTSIVYDSRDDRMFVGTQYGAAPTIAVINASSYKIVDTIRNLTFTPTSLCYATIGDRILVADKEGHAVRVVDAARMSFESSTWAVGAGPDALLIEPVHNWLYVANGGSANVTVINLTSGAYMAHGLPVGQAPAALLYFPPTHSVLVGDEQFGEVSEIPSAGPQPGGNVTNLTGGGGPLAYDPSNDYVFTVGSCPGAFPCTYLSVFAPASSNAVAFNIQLSFTFVASTFDMINGNIYVVNPAGMNGSGNPGRYPPYPPGNSSVMVINGTTHQLSAKSYPAGYGAGAIAYDSANHKLYVANTGDGTVSVIDPATARVSLVKLGPPSLWNLTFPDSIAIDPIRDMIYVADGGTNNVSVIDGSSQSLIATIAVGTEPTSVLYDRSTNEVYVGDCGSNNITVLNGSTGRATGSVPVGRCPDALALFPPTGELFVANEYATQGTYSNLTVVNLSQQKSVGSVAVGFTPVAIAFDPANGYLYVANGYSYNLTVVNGSSRTQVTPGISVTVGYAESYPTSLTYDPLTQEVFVPTSFTSAVYVVGNTPEITSATVAPALAEVGVPVQAQAMVEYGTQPYVVGYSGLPRGCSTADSLQLLCIPREAGNFTLQVAVTDANSYTVTQALPLTVRPPLDVPIIDTTPGLLGVGDRLTITARAVGGVGPYAYTYVGLPPGCTAMNASSLSCFPTSAGWYALSVTVTDTFQFSRTAVAVVQVVGKLTVQLSWTTTPSIQFGSSATLIVQAAGGLAPYVYTYVGLPSGCLSSNSSVLVCTPNATGSFRSEVTVTDARGTTAFAWANLTVVPIATPLPSILAFLATPSSVTLGNSAMLWVVLSGAAPNATFTFAGLPPGCTATNSSRWACVPNETGNYTIEVSVHIGDRSVGKASTNLTVTPASTGQEPPSPDTGDLTLYYEGLAIGLGIAVAFLGGLVVHGVWRNRSRRKD
jgi:YVTN family beta-propeller protein